MDTLIEKTKQLCKLTECLDTLKKISIGRDESELYFIKSTETLVAGEAERLSMEISKQMSIDMVASNEYLESVDRKVSENLLFHDGKGAESIADSPYDKSVNEEQESSIADSDSDEVAPLNEVVADSIQNNCENSVVDETTIELPEDSIAFDNNGDYKQIEDLSPVMQDLFIREEADIEGPIQSDIFTDTVEKIPSLSDNKTKINDIKQSLSIADRFRFQREVFGGSGERMSEILSMINTMETFEEAMRFVDNNLIFDRENKAGRDFIDLLKRRFL